MHHYDQQYLPGGGGVRVTATATATASAAAIAIVVYKTIGHPYNTEDYLAKTEKRGIGVREVRGVREGG